MNSFVLLQRMFNQILQRKKKRKTPSRNKRGRETKTEIDERSVESRKSQEERTKIN